MRWPRVLPAGARINVGRRFAALSWERVTQAAAGDAPRSSERDTHPGRELDAQRSPDDDEFDGDGALSGAKFELESVFVAK